MASSLPPHPLPRAAFSAMQTEMEWEPQVQKDLELEPYIEMTRDVEVEVTMEMEMGGFLGSHLARLAALVPPQAQPSLKTNTRL